MLTVGVWTGTVIARGDLQGVEEFAIHGPYLLAAGLLGCMPGTVSFGTKRWCEGVDRGLFCGMWGEEEMETDVCQLLLFLFKVYLFI